MIVAVVAVNMVNLSALKQFTNKRLRHKSVNKKDFRSYIARRSVS